MMDKHARGCLNIKIPCAVYLKPGYTQNLAGSTAVRSHRASHTQITGKQSFAKKVLDLRSSSNSALTGNYKVLSRMWNKILAAISSLFSHKVQFIKWSFRIPPHCESESTSSRNSGLLRFCSFSYTPAAWKASRAWNSYTGKPTQSQTYMRRAG